MISGSILVILESLAWIFGYDLSDVGSDSCVFCDIGSDFADSVEDSYDFDDLGSDFSDSSDFGLDYADFGRNHKYEWIMPFRG